MRVNVLHRNDEYQILWFHDSFEYACANLDKFDRRTYVIFSFSWYVTRKRLSNIIAQIGKSISNLTGKYVSPNQVLLLMNSRQEFDLANELSTGNAVSFVNNACFLDYNLFKMEDPRVAEYDFLCNAKPLVFKRHYLTQNIPNKVFITYDVTEPDYGITKVVDLEQFKPSEIFRNVPTRKVVEISNKCKVGLIFSEEEGACYASLEYLLCGLPVISTECRGGRDEYYSYDNSLTISPTVEAAASAGVRMLEMLGSGEIVPGKIREQTIKRIETFRSNFLNSLARMLEREIDREAAIHRIRLLMTRNNKMANFRNFFKT